MEGAENMENVCVCILFVVRRRDSGLYCQGTGSNSGVVLCGVKFRLTLEMRRFMHIHLFPKQSVSVEGETELTNYGEKERAKSLIFRTYSHSLLSLYAVENEMSRHNIHEFKAHGLLSLSLNPSLFSSDLSTNQYYLFHNINTARDFRLFSLSLSFLYTLKSFQLDKTNKAIMISHKSKYTPLYRELYSVLLQIASLSSSILQHK